MAISNIKAMLPYEIDKVWEKVTDFENYHWRSDIRKTKRLSETQFIEYTKDGFATTFTITAAKPCSRWELDVENSNIKGHWVGVFSEKGKETEINFTENVTAKNIFMRPLVKAYLKRQQAQFVSDLQKALSL